MTTDAQRIPDDIVSIIINFLPYSTQVHIGPTYRAHAKQVSINRIVRAMRFHRDRILTLIEKEEDSIYVMRAAYILYYHATDSEMEKTILEMGPNDFSGGWTLKRAYRHTMMTANYGYLLKIGW